MTTWSHVRATLWDDDPLRLGECAGRRYCASPGVHRLNLNPAAHPLPRAQCTYLLLAQQPFGGPHDSPTYRGCDSRRYCTDAAFMISPMVPLVS